MHASLFCSVCHHKDELWLCLCYQREPANEYETVHMCLRLGRRNQAKLLLPSELSELCRAMSANLASITAQDVAITVLCKLASCSTSNCRTILAQPECIPCLVNAMDAHADVLDIQREACSLVYHLTAASAPIPIADDMKEAITPRLHRTLERFTTRAARLLTVADIALEALQVLQVRVLCTLARQSEEGSCATWCR